MDFTLDKIKTKLACKRTYYAALRTGFVIVLIGMQTGQKWFFLLGGLLILVNLLKSIKLNKQLKTNNIVFEDSFSDNLVDIALFAGFLYLIFQHKH